MDNTKSNINFSELLTSLLGRLSPREQEILKYRYQLTNDLAKRATLKKIGDMYNITRERVRQIERDALRKLVELKKEQEFADSLAAVEASLVSYLQRQGGLAREDQLVADHATATHELGGYHSEAYLFLAEYLLDAVEKVEDHDDFYQFWHLSELNLSEVEKLVRELESELSRQKSLLGLTEILTAAEKYLSPALKAQIASYLSAHSDLQISDFLRTYLNTSSKIEENILGQWGLAAWQTIRPRKLADKILLVFSKEKNPLHFRDIALRINGAGFDSKKICAATVHNELIANANYVLIGRGIYALKEWGYSEGTVADVIARILQESGKPLSKNDIFERVLGQRKVNKSTIYLTLINKDRFAKNGSNEYFLKA